MVLFLIYLFHEKTKSIFFLALVFIIFDILLYALYINKEKEIEFIKTNALDIVNDTFTLNIDYYTNNESIDFFRKIFDIKKESKAFKKELERESEKLKEILATIDDIILVIKNNEITLNNNYSNTITYNSKSRKYFDSIKYNSLIKKIKSILDSGQNIKEDFFVGEISKYYFIESYNLEKEKSVIISLKDITNTKNFEKIQKEFISNISHELKTPLTNIKGYVIALEDSMVEKDKTTSSFFKTIYSNISKLENLIHDFLNYSKHEGSKILNLGPVKSSDFISEILNDLDMLIKNKNSNINIEYNLKDSDGFIHIDKEKMKLAIKNIVENAVIYSGENAVINIYISENEDSYIFKISDNGSGIPESEINSVFEKFYRVDKSRPMNVSGSGLGLSIVKKIIDNYGGTVVLESIEGLGAQFTISIPK